jgi:hypothetical protein
MKHALVKYSPVDYLRITCNPAYNHRYPQSLKTSSTSGAYIEEIGKKQHDMVPLSSEQSVFFTINRKQLYMLGTIIDIWITLCNDHNDHKLHTAVANTISLPVIVKIHSFSRCILFSNHNI